MGRMHERGLAVGLKGPGEVGAPMAGLPPDVEALVRAAHVGAAVVWLGLVYASALVLPKAMGSLADATRREVLPRLARAMVPWLVWSSVLTVAFGFALYASIGLALGFGSMRWGTNLGAALALLMFALGHLFVVPTQRAMARALDGNAMPGSGRMRRAVFVGRVNAFLSFGVLFFMVMTPRVSWLA